MHLIQCRVDRRSHGVAGRRVLPGQFCAQSTPGPRCGKRLGTGHSRDRTSLRDPRALVTPHCPALGCGYEDYRAACRSASTNSNRSSTTSVSSSTVKSELLRKSRISALCQKASPQGMCRCPLSVLAGGVVSASCAVSIGARVRVYGDRYRRGSLGRGNRRPRSLTECRSESHQENRRCRVTAPDGHGQDSARADQLP